MIKKISIVFCLVCFFSCNDKTPEISTPKNNPPFPKNSFMWKSANLYFLLVDRFYNGNPSNDVNFERTKPTDKLQGFEGGDIRGIIQKIKEGYFSKLGINAIWLSPIFEQMHDIQGKTYGYHGYWIKDWTKIDPNFGTQADLKELVQIAHKNNIRIVLDAVINHTGYSSPKDPLWPSDWVRTGKPCNYNNYAGNVKCNLAGLPDIKTETNTDVTLPNHLVKKWKSEGRYQQEINSLNDFFNRTGYPKAPKYYIIKWLTDYILKYGIDGYRVDTAKHVELSVWQTFRKECDWAFQQWKQKYPEEVLDENYFYLVGEVYGYLAIKGLHYGFSDKSVNFFDNAFNGLINFEFKSKAHLDYESLFYRYSQILKHKLNGYSTLNYISSHDDSHPFDLNRTNTYQAGTKLLLSPGTSQIYYGDESARSLSPSGVSGDTKLRSFMNWQQIQSDNKTKECLQHWRKLGQFRNEHLSVGAGNHKIISKDPYVFQRVLTTNDFTDKVLVGLNMKTGKKYISVGDTFKNGSVLKDYYSNKKVTVIDKKISIDTPYNIVLLGMDN